jgi:hypothetical protein
MPAKLPKGCRGMTITALVVALPVLLVEVEMVPPLREASVDLV